MRAIHRRAGRATDSTTFSEVESMRNITTEPAGKAAPVGEKSEQPTPNVKPPTIVSCAPKRGWIVVEGSLL